MTRKVVVAALVVVVIAVALWLALRGRGHGPAPDTTERPSRAAVTTPQPAPASQPAPAPRGPAPRWLLDADAEGPLRLEGQVVDGDGRGVGGAAVWLSSVPPRTTRSEEDGAFSFDKLVGRSYSVAASRGELLGGPVRVKLTAHSDPVVLRIAEGAAVTVTVLDDAKQPVNGAEVKLDELAERTVRTSDKGIARLAPVHPGFVEVEASAPGYAPNSAFTTIGSAGASGQLTITLHKGFAVSGRVRDETGAPIARARITLGESIWGAARDTGGTTTDDKGAFTVAAIANGRHHLLATDGEHAPAQSPPIMVADRPVTGIEIVMKAGGVLAGNIVDSDRKPVPFATVRVTGANQQVWQTSARQATSDQRGAFELRGLARAKLQLRAESDTAASQLVDADLASQPRRADLVLVLDVAGSIAGTVVDDTGAPVPEVQVNAFPDILQGASTSGLALAGLSSTTTGGGGEFVIRGLPDGAYRIWAARHSGGFGDWGQRGTAARTGDKDVRITLAAPGSLAGKVVLAGSTAPPRLVTVAVGVQMPSPATDGAFQLKDLSPGSYDVTIRGLEFAESIQHDVKIEPGKTTDLGTITVARGRTLAGRVVDKSGAPVAGANIKLGEMLISAADASDQSEGLDSLTGVRSGVSDQDGAFILVGVPPKATNVMADHPDRGRSLAIAIAAGTDDPPPVTLALRGFGSIAGKVTQKGQPVGGVAIGDSSKEGGAQSQFTRTATDGTFALAKVAEGTHVINAIQPGLMAMKSTSATVEVTAGQQATANIEIPVGDVTLTVQVKPLPSNQVDAAQLFLFAGSVNLTTAGQLSAGIFKNSLQGMKFWLGAGKPAPDFAELVAGGYSLCAVPITGDMSDPQFLQRLRQNQQVLKVYCKATNVTATPAAQTLTIELPSMVPLPSPAK